VDAPSLLARYENSLTYAPATISNYKLQVRLFLQWCEETDRDPLDLEDLDFFRYFEERLNSGLGPRSLDPVRSGLKSFYAWLVATGMLASNPVPARSVPQPPNALPATVSIDQLRSLWANAPSVEHKVLVGLVGICGLSPEETLTIDVPDCRVNGQAPAIRLEIQRRHGRSPLMPLSAEMRIAVADCINGRRRGPLLRRVDGQRLDRRTALRWVKATGRLSGLSPAPTARDLSFTLRALAIEHGFSYLSTVRAVGELNPTRSRRWWEHAPNDPERHAATRLANLVFNDPTTPSGAIEEAFRSHYESHLPDAFSVMAAASALERHLRQLAESRGVLPKTPADKMALAPWADLLRGRGVLTAHDQAAVKEVADHRSWAAHGWYERITPEIALRVLEDCRRLVSALPVHAAP
jgi:integrase/recombinase XerD